MKRKISTVLAIILAAVFSASAHGGPKPAAIGKPNAKVGGWSVFGPAQEFQGSPLPHIGRNGLFDVRSSEVKEPSTPNTRSLTVWFRWLVPIIWIPGAKN